MSDTNKLYLSWDKVTQDIHELIESIEKTLPYTVNSETQEREYNTALIRLVIPCRGGEIIWSLVKNSLWLREKQIYRIKFSNLKYEDWTDKVIIKDQYDREKFLDLIEEESSNLFWIFVDDLVDSWLTIDYIRDSLFPKNLIIWVLYSKEWKNEEKTDICVKQLEDKWIVFPWEQFYEK